MSRTKQSAEVLRQKITEYSTAYRKKYVNLRPGETMICLEHMAIRSREDVAKILLCSRQNVTAIERRAIRKIQRRLMAWYQQLKKG